VVGRVLYFAIAFAADPLRLISVFASAKNGRSGRAMWRLIEVNISSALIPWFT
jgi:hypothetical protein